MVQYRCGNCGRIIYDIYTYKSEIDGKVYNLCKQCYKITEEFKNKNAIK